MQHYFLYFVEGYMMRMDMEDDKYLKLLGKRIAQLRKEKGFTQVLFSKASGIERSALARIESGGINSSILKLKQIANALDVDLSKLMV